MLKIIAHFLNLLRNRKDANPLKIAILVGHDRVAKGAYSLAPIELQEFDFWNPIALEAVDKSKKIPSVEVRKFNRQYLGKGKNTASIVKAYKEIDSWGADAVIELHFNAASDPDASYSAVIYSGSKGGLALAKHCSKKFENVFEEKCRIWARSHGDRGGTNVHAGKAKIVLIEPFFGTNPESCQKAKNLGVSGFSDLLIHIIQAYAKEVRS